MPVLSSRMIRSALEALPYYIAAIGMAFAVTGLLLAATGQDVLLGYETIFSTSFRTSGGFALTVLKFVPLYLMALGFAIPLATMKFNVGIEGQFLLGAVGAAMVGIVLGGLPVPILLPLTLAASVLMGALWALVPALLLYYFRVNEIISTILMNFISFQIVSLVALGPWRDETAGHPMTVPIDPGARLPLIMERPPINAGSPAALLLGVIAFLVIYRMVLGYELRASGSNPIAASKFGIRVKLLAPLSLVLGGALAGLAGGFEVTGLHLRLVEGMQSNYTPLAIIATLMARGNPLALLFFTFFIAVIEVGANAMQRTMGAPVEIVLMTEALMMLFIMVAEVIRARRR